MASWAINRWGPVLFLLVIYAAIPVSRGVCPDQCFYSSTCVDFNDEVFQCNSAMRTPWIVQNLAIVLVSCIHAGLAVHGLRVALKVTKRPFSFTVYYVSHIWPLVIAVPHISFSLMGAITQSSTVTSTEDGRVTILIWQILGGIPYPILTIHVLHMAFFWQALLRGTHKLGVLRLIFTLVSIVLLGLEIAFRVNRALAQPPNRVLLVIYLLWNLLVVSGTCLWALMNVVRLRRRMSFGDSMRRQQWRRCGTLAQEKFEFTNRITRFIYLTQLAAISTVVVIIIHSVIILNLGYIPWEHVLFVTILESLKFAVLFGYVLALIPPAERAVSTTTDDTEHPRLVDVNDMLQIAPTVKAIQADAETELHRASIAGGFEDDIALEAIRGRSSEAGHETEPEATERPPKLIPRKPALVSRGDRKSSKKAVHTTLTPSARKRGKKRSAATAGSRSPQPLDSDMSSSMSDTELVPPTTPVSLVHGLVFPTPSAAVNAQTRDDMQGTETMSVTMQSSTLSGDGNTTTLDQVDVMTEPVVYYQVSGCTPKQNRRFARAERNAVPRPQQRANSNRSTRRSARAESSSLSSD